MFYFIVYNSSVGLKVLNITLDTELNEFFLKTKISSTTMVMHVYNTGTY